MENEAVLNGDIIYIYFRGDQTFYTLKDTIDKILELSDQLRRNNKPVLAIADHSNYGKLPPPGAWKACIEPLKEAQYDRVALLGMNAFLKAVTTFILKATGAHHKVRFFANEEEAMKWILDA